MDDVDVREDRHLHDRRDEQDPRSLARVRDHGAFGMVFFVTSAITESSEPKSTYDWI